METFFIKYSDSSAVFLSFPIVQHSCLESGDVFLSLFHSFPLLPHPPLVVAIHDSPLRPAVPPICPCFLSFTPSPADCLRVTIYILSSFGAHLSSTAIFHNHLDMISLNISSLDSILWSHHLMLRVTSVYLLHTNHLPYRSLPPDQVFSSVPHDYLVLGDFNIHHQLADTLCFLTDREYTLSSAYFDSPYEAPFSLVNTPGVYTRFPFEAITRN